MLLPCVFSDFTPYNRSYETGNDYAKDKPTDKELRMGRNVATKSIGNGSKAEFEYAP